MKTINLNTWNRKQHYEHFSALKDPYFSVTIPFNVTNAYKFSKINGVSFFAKYLHDCMKSINEIDNFKYRIENNSVIEYNVIHASATLMRPDKTFGFSFIDFNADFNIFMDNVENEKIRIANSTALYPPKNGLNCIHCSALPWFQFTGQKEPVSGMLESIPKLAFSKIEEIGSEIKMNVAINVNHALVDGYHIGLFSEKFQEYLNM